MPRAAHWSTRANRVMRTVIPGLQIVINEEHPMDARKLAKWAVRAALIGTLAAGALYGAHAASAGEPAPAKNDHSTSDTRDGAVWG